MKIQVSQTFSLPRETFVEKLFFNEDFNEALHRHLEFRERTILEAREDGEKLLRRIQFVTNEKLPWVARKMLGDAYAGWVEEQVYHRGDYRLETRMRSNILAERIHATGVMRFEDVDGQTRRSYEMDVVVDLPVGVGKAIAKRMLESTMEQFERNRRFTERWIQEHELT